jgi:hypothetical protein
LEGEREQKRECRESERKREEKEKIHANQISVKKHLESV